MTQVRIKASGRVVPVQIEGDSFFVLRPLTRHGAALRAVAEVVPVAGPFKVSDPRFAWQVKEIVQ